MRGFWVKDGAETVVFRNAFGLLIDVVAFAGARRAVDDFLGDFERGLVFWSPIGDRGLGNIFDNNS